ncbi:MAG: glycosyltransferase family 39 protein [Planctomycetota bacterium]
MDCQPAFAVAPAPLPDPAPRDGPFQAVAASLLVLATLGWVVARGPAYNPDAVSYDALARCLFAGDLWSFVTSCWSPGYPVALAPFLAIGLSVHAAALILSLLSGVAAMALMPRVGRFLGLSTWAIRIAMLLLAISPLWIVQSTIVSPDHLVVPLFLLYLLRVLRMSRSPSPRDGAIAGLLAGLMFWVRGFMLPFGLAALPIALLFAPRGRRLAAGAAYAAVLSAVAAPWVLATTLKYERPIVFTVGGVLRRLTLTEEFTRMPAREAPFLIPKGPWNLHDYYPPGSPFWDPPKPGYGIPLSLQANVCLSNLVGVARILANPGYGMILLLAALGFAAWWRAGHPRDVLRLLSWVAVYAGGYAVLQVRDRYFLTFLPFLFLLAAHGLTAAGICRALRAAALVFIVSVTVLQAARRVEETLRLEEGRLGLAYREAGRQIREGGGGAMAVLSEAKTAGKAASLSGRGVAVAHFGNAPYVALECPDPTGRETFRRLDVRWVVIDGGARLPASFLASNRFRRVGVFGPFASSPAFELWRLP